MPEARVPESESQLGLGDPESPSGEGGRLSEGTRQPPAAQTARCPDGPPERSNPVPRKRRAGPQVPPPPLRPRHHSQSPSAAASTDHRQRRRSGDAISAPAPAGAAIVLPPQPPPPWARVPTAVS
nr:proline-rich proteoglycan 2-like [Odocoileus virginianus texanus]